MIANKKYLGEEVDTSFLPRKKTNFKSARNSIGPSIPLKALNPQKKPRIKKQKMPEIIDEIKIFQEQNEQSETESLTNEITQDDQDVIKKLKKARNM